MGTIRNWKRLAGLMIVVIIVLAVGKVLIVCSAPEQPTSLKIGIVNLQDVFSKFKKRNQYQDQLKKSEEEESVQIKKIEDRIRELQKQLDDIRTPESDLWNAIAGEVDVLKIQREQRIKSWNKRMTKKINDQLSELYNEIRTAVDKYAKDKGFTLILKTDPPRIRNEEDQQEMAQMGMNTRTVLQYDKAMDITQDIIKILNGE